MLFADDEKSPLITTFAPPSEEQGYAVLYVGTFQRGSRPAEEVYHLYNRKTGNALGSLGDYCLEEAFVLALLRHDKKSPQFAKISTHDTEHLPVRGVLVLRGSGRPTTTGVLTPQAEEVTLALRAKRHLEFVQYLVGDPLLKVQDTLYDDDTRECFTSAQRAIQHMLVVARTKYEEHGLKARIQVGGA
jgi:hypothetical protein